MTAELSVALVGAGAMAHNHARVLTECTRTRLDLVMDIDSERAAKLAADVGCGWTTEIDGWGFDAVVIASPAEAHTEAAVAALGAGVPVLVEKPMAVSPVDVRRILRASELSGAPVTCGFVERFNPVVQTARGLIEDAPVHVVALRHSPRNPRVATSVVHDLLIHDIDLAILVGGGDVLQASGACWAPPGSPVTEVADAVMRLGSGMIATLSASRASQRKIRSMQVSTARQLFDLDLLRQTLTVYEHAEHPPGARGPDYRAKTLVDIPFIRHAGEPLALQLKHFLGLIEGTVDPAVERASLLAPHVTAAQVAA